MNCLRSLFLILVLVLTTSCEDTNVGIMADAGIDVIKAVTLSDSRVAELARQASDLVDSKSRIAPPGNPHDKRLSRLVGVHLAEDGRRFSYKV